MTSARIQPFSKKHNINKDCYDGFGRCSRKTTEKNLAFYMYKHNFRLIWKSNSISFNKAIKELKTNFRVVDVVICDEHFEKFSKQENKPEKL